MLINGLLLIYKAFMNYVLTINNTMSNHNIGYHYLIRPLTKYKVVVNVHVIFKSIDNPSTGLFWSELRTSTHYSLCSLYKASYKQIIINPQR